jgi:hypothetical protein
MRQIVAYGELAGAKRPAGEACIRLIAVAELQRLILRAVHRRARGEQRSCNAPVPVDDPERRVLVAADLGGDTARFPQQVIAIADAQYRGIDTALHPHHAREMRGLLFKLPALGDVPRQRDQVAAMPVLDVAGAEFNREHLPVLAAIDALAQQRPPSSVRHARVPARADQGPVDEMSAALSRNNSSRV